MVDRTLYRWVKHQWWKGPGVVGRKEKQSQVPEGKKGTRKTSVT